MTTATNSGKLSPARVSIQIDKRDSFADGESFGKVGPYERLTGRAHFQFDPGDPAQAGVHDIDLAVVNASGLVECTSDLYILRPSDPEGGNRRLFFDYGNRGNKRALQYFNDAPATNDPRSLPDAGNGFLFRRGYTMVWAGWQADLLAGDGRLLLDVPVATDAGQPVTGLVRTEFTVESVGIDTLPLSGATSTRSHPVAAPGQAHLTRRRYPFDVREEIPASGWSFARTELGRGEVSDQESALIASDVHLHLRGGFEPGWIYELAYIGRDPLVMGLGHVVIRDLISYLRHSDEPSNPLAGRVDKAYAWGRSQTGRCIRDFVHKGFNSDANGDKVFDGVMPHVSGGGLMNLDYRFANAVSMPGQQYEKSDSSPSDRFPFSYAVSTDHLTGRNDGILTRPASDPLVMHTQSATEYWQRHGSLVHTDTKGNDLEQPACVRMYLWASSQHISSPFAPQTEQAACQNLLNVVSTSMLFRALIDSLDAWATNGTEPPASRIPMRAGGTLVTGAEWRRRFPAIPGVMLPSEPSQLPLLDFGPNAEEGILDADPPAVIDGDGYTVQVPATDADGNDIAGIRAPMVQAPLGTYTGWNMRARGYGHGAMHSIVGSYLPFPETSSEAKITNDPRPSILERYGDSAGYSEAIRASAEGLVAEGLMLAEDVPRSVSDALDWGRSRHSVRLERR